MGLIDIIILAVRAAWGTRQAWVMGCLITIRGCIHLLRTQDFHLFQVLTAAHTVRHTIGITMEISLITVRATIIHTTQIITMRIHPIQGHTGVIPTGGLVYTAGMDQVPNRPAKKHQSSFSRL